MSAAVPREPAAAQAGPGPYGIVVSAGTDSHAFPRLVEWAEVLAAAFPSAGVMVQHGITRAPRPPVQGIAGTTRERLLQWYREADVVIVQGGPGSILDARLAGAIPLVVPRDPRLGEHVDGHQMDFVPVMEDQGDAVHIRDLPQLVEAVRERLQDPASGRAEPREAAPEAATRHFGELVDGAWQRTRSGQRPRRERLRDSLRRAREVATRR